MRPSQERAVWALAILMALWLLTFWLMEMKALFLD